MTSLVRIWPSCKGISGPTVSVVCHQVRDALATSAGLSQNEPWSLSDSRAPLSLLRWDVLEIPEEKRRQVFWQRPFGREGSRVCTKKTEKTYQVDLYDLSSWLWLKHIVHVKPSEPAMSGMLLQLGLMPKKHVVDVCTHEVPWL